MENNHKASSSSPHIVMIPSPGMGHLIPLIELAKLLIHHHHNFTITFIIPTIGPPPKPQENLLQSLPTSINHFFLPPIDFHDLPPETKTETKITLAVTRSLPKIRNVFESLVANSSVVGLVVDLFGTDAFDVAKEFNVPSYLFWSSMAMGLILLLHLPKLDKMVSCEYKDMDEPVKLPGCIPISGAEFPEPLQDRKSEAYKWFLRYGKRVDLAEGVILNSFKELEPEAIKTLQDEIGLCGPPVYPVRPIIQTGPSDGPGGHECLKCPDNKASNAAFFSVQSQTDPLGFLPKGFRERTRSLGRGLLVPSWAPQSEVLSHGSIGGFLSHCGWNSILESIANGVPLIAWPLYAEQKMNANVLCQGLKVALRPKADENGMVRCEEIFRVVKELMEGEEGFRVRERMNGWKKAANKALSEEGSSIEALSELVMKLKKQAWN
ncbi:hypothetical protein ACLB2K_074333 [Fragaria x ananassa]